MIYELIVIGGIWFWTLFILVSIAIISCLDFDRTWESLWLLGVFLVVLLLFSDGNALTWIANNPVKTLLIVLAYCVIGAAWAICKWYLFVRNRLRQYIVSRKCFLESRNIKADRNTAVPPEHRQEWETRMRNYHLGPPHAMDHKSRIVMWMTYWPWSMFWTLLRDTIREVFTFIYERIGGILAAISRRLYSGVNGDFN